MDITLEGLSADELLALPPAGLDALVLTGGPVVFRLGSATLLAEVRVDGQVLGVMDEFSPISPEEWARGLFEFGALLRDDDDPGGWERTFGGNPERVKRLVRTGDWSYEGYGQVVSIRPVVVDFGVLRLEVGDWTNDSRCVGEYVFVPIARLDLRLLPPGNGLPRGQASLG